MLQAARNLSRSIGLGKLLLQNVIEPAQQLWRLRLPDRNCVLSVNAFEMEVINPRRNRIGEALYRSGCWEPQVTAAVRDLVRPGMNVIDVGADVGYYTLLFAALAAPGTVVAFEPIPACRQMCQGNLTRNGIQNVRLLEFALGNEERTAVLRDPLNTSRIDLGAQSASESDLEVRIHRFDDLGAEFLPGKVDFVKIDVEGAEHEVLRGMEATIRRHRPVLLIEVHGTMLPQFGSSKSMLAGYLASMGYSWRLLDGDSFDGPATSTLVFEPASEKCSLA